MSATSTTGRFVGAASGSALGAWYAEVVHDLLGGGVGAHVAIRSGGSFGMALAQAEPAYVVSGQFSGGTITVKDPGAHCTDQVYTVDGSLQERVGDRDRGFRGHADASPKVGPGPVLAVCGDGRRHCHAGLIACTRPPPG